MSYIFNFVEYYQHTTALFLKRCYTTHGRITQSEHMSVFFIHYQHTVSPQKLFDIQIPLVMVTASNQDKMSS